MKEIRLIFIIVLYTLASIISVLNFIFGIVLNLFVIIYNFLAVLGYFCITIFVLIAISEGIDKGSFIHFLSLLWVPFIFYIAIISPTLIQEIGNGLVMICLTTAENQFDRMES